MPNSSSDGFGWQEAKAGSSLPSPPPESVVRCPAATSGGSGRNGTGAALEGDLAGPDETESGNGIRRAVPGLRRRWADVPCSPVRGDAKITPASGLAAAPRAVPHRRSPAEPAAGDPGHFGRVFPGLESEDPRLQLVAVPELPGPGGTGRHIRRLDDNPDRASGPAGSGRSAGSVVCVADVVLASVRGRGHRLVCAVRVPDRLPSRWGRWPCR